MVEQKVDEDDDDDTHLAFTTTLWGAGKGSPLKITKSCAH